MEWYEQIRDSLKQLDEVSTDLSDLVWAFNRTGNQDTLNLMSQQINLARDTRAVGDHIRKDFQQAREASLNMLKAALIPHESD